MDQDDLPLDAFCSAIARDCFGMHANMKDTATDLTVAP